jgi:Fur family peroxide stress response transcriptional regulator
MPQPTISKYSRQRDLVRRAIACRYDHPTAEDVYLTLRQTEPKISLATVYRNLDKLVDDGLVSKFMVPDEPDHYDPVRGEHYHVRCEQCGRIFDINLRLAKKLAHIIKKQTGLNMTTLQLIADGRCEHCQCGQREEAE